MRRFKKIGIFAVLACVLTFGTYAFAEDWTLTGTSDRAKYNYATNTKTIVNELKTDHNTVMGSYSSTRAMANTAKTAHNTVMASYSAIRADYKSLRAKYNLLFANLSALNWQAGRTGGFASYTGTQKITMGNQRIAGSADATVLTGSRVTASSDSTVITGGRTTSTSLSLTGL